MTGTRSRRALLLAAVLAAAGCGDGPERGEGVPPSSTSDSSILADTVKRDATDRTAPNYPG